MSTTFDELPEPIRLQVQETFAGLEEARAWRAGDAGEAQLVSTLDLIALARAPMSAASARVRAAMRGNRRLTASFAAILDEMGALAGGELAAASSGEVLERSDPDAGYALRLIESTADTREVHLVIEFGDTIEAAFGHLFLLPKDGEVVVLELEPGENPVHILLERDSKALQLLKLASTELKFL